MGNGASVEDGLRFEAYIKKQYMLAKGQENLNRHFLVLDEISSISVSELIPIDLNHIAVLFAINSTSTGKIQLKELLDFSRMCHIKFRYKSMHEACSQSRAYCIMKLWEYLKSEPSHYGTFARWIVRLMRENVLVRGHEKHIEKDYFKVGNVEYLSVNSFEKCLDLLHIPNLERINTYVVINSLQDLSEEIGHIDIDDERHDDFISIEAIETFLVLFTKSWVHSMQDYNIMYKSKKDENVYQRS